LNQGRSCSITSARARFCTTSKGTPNLMLRLVAAKTSTWLARHLELELHEVPSISLQPSLEALA
jgi:hypothetical protein